MPLEPGAVPSKDMDARQWSEWNRRQKPGPAPAHDYANDAAAEAAGIQIGQLYHTSGTVKVRLT